MNTFDKFMISGMAFLVIVTITIIGLMTLELIDHSAKREREYAYHKAACLELNPKYDERYRAKRGFYKDYAMSAISATDTSVVLKSYEGPVRFLCSEIERQK